jgi:hypothetical protein
MGHIETGENGLVIVIPDAGVQDLRRFRKGLLSILSKITIENCDSEFKENLKAVYELLSHLQIEEFLLPMSAEKVNDMHRNVMVST